MTDNKPLSQVIGPDKQLPALAASRIQRWSLKLAEYNFTVEVRRSSQIPVADWLSRLPEATSVTASNEPEDDCTVCLLGQVHSLQPITAATIQAETRKDPALSRVLRYIETGWPDHVPENLQTFKGKEAELKVEMGCILWGLRVVVPTKLRTQVLQELHAGHQGIVRMKQLARLHVWWPCIDKDIEEEAKACEGCREKRAEPPKSDLHPWEFARGPWQRIHIDFAGPVQGMFYLVIIDSFSKWMEVAEMKDITTARTIKVLLNLFARWGVPHQLVSDNGPQLTSAEFEGFLKRNGVRHILTAPYKPSTNGAAERAVGSLKGFLKATKGSHTNLPNFLMAYRNTPQATTGRSPAELMLGRQLRTRLDLLRPDLRSHVQEKQATQVQQRRGPTRHMDVGDTVLARDYRGRGKWAEGQVVDVMGDKHYSIQVHDQVWRRHIDQLLPMPAAMPHQHGIHNRQIEEPSGESRPQQSGHPATHYRPVVPPPPSSPMRTPEVESPARRPASQPEPPEPSGGSAPSPEPVCRDAEVTLRRSTRVIKPVQRLDL